MRVGHSNQTAFVQVAERLLNFLSREHSAALQLSFVLPLRCHVMVVRVRDRHVIVQHILTATESFKSEIHLTAIRVPQSSDYEVQSLFQVIETLEMSIEVCWVDEAFRVLALL